MVVTVTSHQRVVNIASLTCLPEMRALVLAAEVRTMRCGTSPYESRPSVVLLT